MISIGATTTGSQISLNAVIYPESPLTFAKTTQIVFIDTCSSIYFMGRSKCGSNLLMIVYNIQANHDAMGQGNLAIQQIFKEITIIGKINSD